MAPFTLLVTERVLNVLRTFNHADRREVRRLLGVIQQDPSLDNAHKIRLEMPPVVFTAYVTSRFWIVYHVTGSRITVTNVGHAGISVPIPW